MEEELLSMLHASLIRKELSRSKKGSYETPKNQMPISLSYTVYKTKDIYNVKAELRRNNLGALSLILALMQMIDWSFMVSVGITTVMLPLLTMRILYNI